ncbi:S8 family serine peptidase [Thalassolituus sp.]|uniref:S8 family serine peptidase n=1 Tax=Thalassolituus sp. TaxID=2030822 RepID=UPI003518AA14
MRILFLPAMITSVMMMSGCLLQSSGSTSEIEENEIPSMPRPNPDNCNSTQNYSITSRLASTLLATSVISACTGGGGGSEPTYNVSGQLYTSSNLVIDSDLNDINASFISNNDPDNPQPLPNIVTVQGFASKTGTGAQASQNGSLERFASNYDEDDFYSVSLQRGQVITLNVVDDDGNTTEGIYQGDLDLYLYDPDSLTGLPISTSNGTEATEEITVPADGEYLLLVSAYSGISKYVLQLTAAETSIVSTGNTSPLSTDFVPGEALIRWKDSASSIKATGNSVMAYGHQVTALSSASDYPVRATISAPLTLQTQQQKSKFAQKMPGAFNHRETLNTIKALNARDDVEYAEPNYVRKAVLTPNDPLYRYQYHYNDIKLPQAWDLTSGSSDVTVAVIDTGVFLNHPDLSGKLVSGYDFISSTAASRDGNGIDNNPDDPGDSNQQGASSWHGTHVSGTVAAITGNNRGGAGVGGDTKVMPLRALGLNGEGTSYDIIQCIRFAARLSNDSNTLPTKKADIINLSLGSEFSSDAEQEAITAARNQGVIIVAAAGNEDSSQAFYPASYDGVISVSATAPNNSRAYYSNYGSKIDVAAPGGDLRYDTNGDLQSDGVVSTSVDDSTGTRAEDYNLQQGTSMASPHVAGVIALMKAVYPELTPQNVDDLLANGSLTDDIGSTGRDNDFGHGLINAYKAVNAANDLAGGGAITPVPVLEADPDALSMGSSSAISFTLSNINDNADDPAVTAEVSEDWMSLDASLTTDGLGEYTLNIDRTDLLDGIYEGLILFTPDDGNPLEVRVSMLVGEIVDLGDSAPQYVLVIDDITGEVAAEALVNADGTYTVEGVPAGSYRVTGGSDIDVDYYICQNGETCGGYPDSISEEVIAVSADVTGIDFIVSIVSGLGSGAASIQAQRSVPVVKQEPESSDTSTTPVKRSTVE